jgi:predicted dehydrogenase
LNRIRTGLRTGTLEAAWPPAREGLVIVEGLRTFVPDAIIAAPRRSRAARVWTDYPGASAKLVDYVLREGLAPTLEKTRTKLDQQRVSTDLAMSAVGTVAACDGNSGFAVGDTVACGGFLLPLEADAYLFHRDQCRKVPRDAAGLEGHFWLGALIEMANRLAESGAASVGGFGLGALGAAFETWLAERDLRRGTGAPDAVVAGSSWWLSSGASALPSTGLVLDPFGACEQLPAGWAAVGLPDRGRTRTSPFDPRPLEWPYPFGPAGRKAATEILLRGASPAPAAPPPAPRPLRVDLHASSEGEFGVSIVGCGNFARAVLLFHAMRVPGVRLRGVCDIRPEVAAVHAGSLGAAFHTADYAQLLADERTQAILVTTDHGSHAAHVVGALEAGKAVHVEKPPAVSPEQLTHMLTALESTGGTLTIGYNRPYAPAYPWMMEAVAGERGPIAIAMIVKGFKLPSEHWYYWPDQGTRLAGNLVHWIDLGYRIAGGASPVSVQVARDRGRHPADAADTAAIAIRFDDGSIASIAFTSAGDDLRGVREWIEIGRGEVSVRIEDFDRIEIVRGARIVRKRFGRDRGHAAEIRDAVRKLRAREPDEAGIRDMIVTSAILFAAQRSFESGREESVCILDAWRPHIR